MATEGTNKLGELWNRYQDYKGDKKAVAKGVMDTLRDNYSGNASPELIESSLDKVDKGQKLEEIVASLPSKVEKIPHSPEPTGQAAPKQNIGYLAKAAMLAAGVALFAYTGIPYFP